MAESSRREKGEGGSAPGAWCQVGLRREQVAFKVSVKIKGGYHSSTWVGERLWGEAVGEMEW